MDPVACEREPHVDGVEEAVDRRGRLHERARVVVEGRLEARGARDLRGPRGVADEARPRGVVERVGLGAAAGGGGAGRGSGVGERRQRQARGSGLGRLREDAQRRLELGQGRREGIVVGEGQLDPAAGELEARAREPVAQLAAAPEVADGPQVDPRVPGLDQRLHHVVGRDDLGALGRQLEHPEAHGGAGDGHPHAADPVGWAVTAARGAGVVRVWTMRRRTAPRSRRADICPDDSTWQRSSATVPDAPMRRSASSA
ncbi:hypothetical protein [Clavibacter michiganensis]|uniref:hypothetical protein n=1 Tax=Clavibacter michiganensis TaxID=28447 RepID=UPI001C6309DF|nr:hypothetical protein [Clavibacter michiganensis]